MITTCARLGYVEISDAGRYTYPGLTEYEYVRKDEVSRLLYCGEKQKQLCCRCGWWLQCGEGRSLLDIPERRRWYDCVSGSSAEELQLRVDGNQGTEEIDC